MADGGMVILGAGECGARAAFAMRENGYDGPVTLIGNESHLPYERPPLSKSAIADEASHKPISPLERYRDCGIDLRLGTVASSIEPDDQTILLSGGVRIRYDRLLLATGARPRLLPGAISKHGRIRYLRTFDDAVDLRSRLGVGKSLAIIGAGFIGLELAATARALGTKVSVIEAQQRVLMRGVPESIASVVSARHVEEGVDLRCGTPISSISEDSTKVTITLGDGSTCEAEIAVVGIGALPNTSLAEARGLRIENGIAVDDRLRTSAANIFAAGDCCSFPLPIYRNRRVRLEAWRNAQDHGNLAAKNMLGADEPVSAIPYFWSDQYDLTLQVAGLSEGSAATIRRDLDDGAFILFDLDAEGTLIAASGIGRGNAIGRDIRLVERMIGSRSILSPEDLASPHVRLKSLLAA